MSALTRAAAYGGKNVDRYASGAFSDRNVDHDYDVSGAPRGKMLVVFLPAMPVIVEMLPEPPRTAMPGILPVNISGTWSRLPGSCGAILSNTSFADLPGASLSNTSFAGISGTTLSNTSFARISGGGVLNNTSTFGGPSHGNIFGGATGLSCEPLIFGVTLAADRAEILLSDPAEGPSLAACLELLRSRRGLLRTHESAGLERQLRALLGDESELEGVAASRTSLDGLIAFLAAHQPSTHPNVALNRAGHFTASWSPRPRAKVTLCFSATNADTADWVGVDLTSEPALRGIGAIVIGSLSGMATPFRTWVAS